MPTLTVETTRSGTVTFVEVLLEAERPHRIRFESSLDGAVWPPRRNGRPVDGWDERGITTRIEAGTTPFGFATPASPEEPVVELVRSEPLDGAGLPAGISSWLQQVKRRVETAERLAAIDDLPSATAALAAIGGLAALEEFEATFARDRRAVLELSFVSDELCERIEAVELPTETFARLA